MTPGKGPEAETLTKNRSPRSEGDAKLLEELCQCLHDLSQPMTVLLCALEYGGGVGSMGEMKEMMQVSQRACERLRGITTEMREKVRDAMEETPADVESMGPDRQ